MSKRNDGSGCFAAFMFVLFVLYVVLDSWDDGRQANRIADLQQRIEAIERERR